MRRFRTHAIILNRTDYGEADRIMGFLTPDHGKLKAIAKGVRKAQSKLAGGIELFSVSDISFIPGRKDISTLVSTRLIKHYGKIVEDLNRTNTGYALIKRLDKATEDSPESDYFYLLEAAFEALNDPSIDLAMLELWFNMQLLRLAGHTPDLRTDTAGQRLQAGLKYRFETDRMRFAPSDRGEFNTDHIKFMRLGFSPNSAKALSRVKGGQSLAIDVTAVVQAMLQAHIRL